MSANAFWQTCTNSYILAHFFTLSVFVTIVSRNCQEHFEKYATCFVSLKRLNDCEFVGHSFSSCICFQQHMICIERNFPTLKYLTFSTLNLIYFNTASEGQHILHLLLCLFLWTVLLPLHVWIKFYMDVRSQVKIVFECRIVVSTSSVWKMLYHVSHHHTSLARNPNKQSV